MKTGVPVCQPQHLRLVLFLHASKEPSCSFGGVARADLQRLQVLHDLGWSSKILVT